MIFEIIFEYLIICLIYLIIIILNMTKSFHGKELFLLISKNYKNLNLIILMMIIKLTVNIVLFDNDRERKLNNLKCILENYKGMKNELGTIKTLLNHIWDLIEIQTVRGLFLNIINEITFRRCIYLKHCRVSPERSKRKRIGLNHWYWSHCLWFGLWCRRISLIRRGVTFIFLSVVWFLSICPLLNPNLKINKDGSTKIDHFSVKMGPPKLKPTLEPNRLDIWIFSIILVSRWIHQNRSF